MWGNLVQLAEDVRDGKRQEHKAVIDEKKELYGWIEQSVQVLFDKLEREKQNLAKETVKEPAEKEQIHVVVEKTENERTVKDGVATKRILVGGWSVLPSDTKV